MNPSSPFAEVMFGDHASPVLHELGGKTWDEAWAAIRPTAFGDDTCEDFLRMIEKGQHEPFLLDHLAECRAMLPQLHREILELADGATYADAVQALRTGR